MSRILSINNKESEALVIEHLRNGEIAILPCDTIYGIVGMVPISKEKIQAVKGRSETKNFIQLVTLDMALSLSSTHLSELLLSYWPGPLTLIVETKNGGSLALRVPNDPLLQSIITSLNAPIYSSSVNTSNEETIHDFSEIVIKFHDRIPLFLKGSNTQGTVASTILDVRKNPYTLIRSGVVEVSSLLAGK